MQCIEIEQDLNVLTSSLSIPPKAKRLMKNNKIPTHLNAAKAAGKKDYVLHLSLLNHNDLNLFTSMMLSKVPPPQNSVTMNSLGVVASK